MGRWSKYILDRRVIISGKCVNMPWGGDQNTMVRGVKIPWEIGSLYHWSIYHGEGGGQNTMGRGSIFHG